MIQPWLNRFARLDLGFIGSRLLLMLPLIAIERQAVDQTAAAEGLRDFQSCFFLSTIAIFGAFEHYVVSKHFLARTIAYLAARFVAIGIVGALLDQMGWINFSVGIWFFLATVRGGSGARLVQLRAKPREYLFVFASTAVAVSILLINVDWWIFAAIPSIAAISWTTSNVKTAHPQQAPCDWTAELRGGTPYFLSQFLSASFFQGSLFLYLMLSTDESALVATRVYLFAFAAIIPVSMAGRAVLVHANELDAEARSKFLAKGLWITSISGGLGASFIWCFSRWIEQVFYGSALVSGSSLIFLGLVVLTHNVSAFLASFIISIGKIRGQLTSSLAGLATIAIVLGVTYSYYEAAYACSLFCGSFIGLAMRLSFAMGTSTLRRFVPEMLR